MWPLQSAFDRYRWASSPASRVWMLPLSIMAVSVPPGLNQAPGSSFHRRTPSPGLLLGRPGLAELSPAFAGSRSVGFHPRGFPSVVRGSRHYFRSFRPVSPDRVLGMHATPLPLGGKVPPGRRPSCARILLQHPTLSAGPFA